MEVEKASSKSNGFFKIFDWGSKTKKPKKRLFANSPTSEKTTDRKDIDGTRLNLVEEDQMTVISSINGIKTEQSCSSSVTEEELIMKKPTGVVARLMGLDSMPVSNTPDPLSSPPFQPKLDPSISEPSGRKMVMLKPHNKMPSSPIERFQTETIPNKSGSKMVPITYYNLLSPIKSNNNFISGRNADQIMEVASRIIDSNSNFNFNLNMSPFRVYDSGRFVRGNPKPVNRRLNIVQDGGDLNGEKGKRKVSVPLQNQTRVNVPKREIPNPKRGNNQKKTVLVQNNRKQNSLSTRSGTQRLNAERNNNNSNNSFGKNRVANQLKGNSNKPFENGESKLANRNNSRMKRLSTISEASHASTSTANHSNHNNYIYNNNNNNDILVKRSVRRVNISGSKKASTNNSSNNIVSFTFTSPVDKFHKNVGIKKDLSSSENIIDGDYLGVLLEQKLRELTSGSGSPYRKSAQGVENGMNEPEISSSFIGELVPVGENESVSSEKIRKQENERESINEKNSEQMNDLSPFSTLDVPLSIESCNSSESWESSKGGKSCTSIQATKALDSFRFNEVLEIEDEETEFSESGSSITIITEMPSPHNPKNTPELDFIREILNSVTISGEKVIFENKEILESFQEEEKDVRISKKMLFGCIYEFLEMKCGYYFGAGYNLWFKGDLFVKKLSAEELFKEIWVEKGVEEESMVDVLVDRDMSTQLGKWVDFEIETFESGIEIEGEILGFLIDELVGELVRL